MKYNRSSTMQLLGNRCIAPFLDRQELATQYKEVFEAIKEECPLMNEIECFDLFMLGYIWGKRDERVRRKKAL